MNQHLFRRFLSGSWHKIAVLSVLGALGSACGVYMALISKKVVDTATGQVPGRLLPIGLLLLGVLLLQLLLEVLLTVLHVDTVTKIRFKIQSQLFERYLHKQKRSVEGFHSGELVNRISGDSSIVAEGVGNVIPSLISVGTRILLSFGALLMLDSVLAVLCVLAGILMLGFARLYRKMTGDIFRECRACEGRIRSFIQETAQNLTVIKAFSVYSVVLRQLGRAQDDAYALTIRKNRLSIGANICFYVAMSAGYYMALAYGAWQISRGVMTFGTLTAVLGLTGDVTTPFRDLASLFPQYLSIHASEERLEEIWNLPEEEELPAADTDALYQSLFEIQISDLDFSYGTLPVLRHADASFLKNKLTAVTGNSGAGKSTLLNLLAGILRPDFGAITLKTANGGVPLNSALRGMFAYVPQDFLLLSGSVLENITLFEEEPDMERFKAAVRMAECEDVIDALPDGIYTFLGEGGGRLSGGQRQRMAIARALYSRAQILLMDESTSALSADTEEKILRHLCHSGRTVIFVTHRDTVSALCDRVLHMQDGKITLQHE